MIIKIALLVMGFLFGVLFVAIAYLIGFERGYDNALRQIDEQPKVD